MEPPPTLDQLTLTVAKIIFMSDIKESKELEEGSDTVAFIKKLCLMFTKADNFYSLCVTEKTKIECDIYNYCEYIFKKSDYFTRFVHFLNMIKIREKFQKGGFNLNFFIALVFIGTYVVTACNYINKETTASLIDAAYCKRRQPVSDIYFSKTVSLYNVHRTCQYHSLTYMSKGNFAINMSNGWRDSLLQKQSTTTAPTRDMSSYVNMTAWSDGVTSSTASNIARDLLAQIHESVTKINPQVSSFVLNTVAEVHILDVSSKSLAFHVFNVLYEPQTRTMCLQDLDFAYTKGGTSDSTPWSFCERGFWNGTELQDVDNASIKIVDNIFLAYDITLKLKFYPTQQIKFFFRFENPAEPTYLGYGCLSKQECAMSAFAIDVGIKQIYDTYKENVFKIKQRDLLLLTAPTIVFDTKVPEAESTKKVVGGSKRYKNVRRRVSRRPHMKYKMKTRTKRNKIKCKK